MLSINLTGGNFHLSCRAASRPDRMRVWGRLVRRCASPRRCGGRKTFAEWCWGQKIDLW